MNREIAEEIFKKKLKKSKIEPKKDCKRCYGRGYIGLEQEIQMLYPCRCIIKKYNDILRKR